MVKLNRAVVLSVVFSLTISLLFSSCKIDHTEDAPSSNEIEETNESETSSSDTEQTDNTDSSYATSEINYPYDLSVKIIGSDKDGDCTIIRYKSTEILIDTSLGDASLKAVKEILDEKKEDEDHIWDYVIFTHPDKDHIGKAPDFFELLDSNKWKVNHVIDFGIELEEDQESDDEKKILSKYKEALTKLESKDYYSPNGDLSLSRLTKEYVIDSRFKLTFLYNQKNDTGKDNDQSVCCLFTIGEQKLLFTGDLERSGEHDLYKNHAQLLRNVTFFKAGHHGSNTSHNREFVDWIRPAYVAITYNHEITEDELSKSISSFLKYTDYIYPTVVKNDIEGVNSLFGNCIFEFNGKNVKVSSDENNNCTIKQAVIKETMTRWYWKLVSDSKISDEINTYFFDENTIMYSDGVKDTYDKPGNLSYFNCTLVKYGHYDILIDCGSNHTDSKAFVEKLKDYVVDGTIEYVVVSHYQLPNYSQLIGSSIYDEGVFKQFRIENIIDNDSSMTNCYNTAGTAYSVYLSKVLTVSNRISIKAEDFIELPVCDSVKLSIYRGCEGTQQDNEDDYSLVTVIDFNANQMVFVGDLTKYSWFNSEYGNKLKKVRLLRFSSSYVDYTKMEGLDSFLNNASPDVIILGSPVNHWNNGQYFIRKNSFADFITFLENSSKKRNIKIYTPGYIDNNLNRSAFGDIAFTLFGRVRTINDTPYEYYVSCCMFQIKDEENNELYKNLNVIDELNTSYYEFVPVDLRGFPAMK